MVATPFAAVPADREKIEPLVLQFVDSLRRVHPKFPGRPNELVRNMLHFVEIGRSGSPEKVHQRLSEFLGDQHVTRRSLGRNDYRRRINFLGGSRSRADAHQPLSSEYGIVFETARLADSYGFNIMHGSNPGIGAAAHEGARSGSGAYGVAIEEPDNPHQQELGVHADQRIVLKTPEARKWVMAHYSDAYAVAPVGIGGADQAYGLITALQCGTIEPRPLVLLEAPGGNFWKTHRSEVWNRMLKSGTISKHDILIADSAYSAEEFIRHISDFYSNFHSLQFGHPNAPWDRSTRSYVTFGLNAEPTADDIGKLNRDLGRFVGAQPFRHEPKRPGHPHEVSVSLGVKGESHFREMISEINRLDSAVALQRAYDLDTDFDLRASMVADRNAFIDGNTVDRLKYVRPVSQSARHSIEGLALEFVEQVEQVLGRVDAPAVLAETISQVACEFADGATRAQQRSVARLAVEMHQAEAVSEHTAERRGITVFGSARTKPGDPSYDQAVDFSVHMHALGYFIITGGGPGQMWAARIGADGGRGAIDVLISLPHEPDTGIRPDSLHYVKFMDFTTRKVGLMQPSSAFVCTKGGFGTLDELFEVLVHARYGKARPIVLLDAPGDDFWASHVEVLEQTMFGQGRVDEESRKLFIHTSDIHIAAKHVSDYYRNYRDMTVERKGSERHVTMVVNAPVSLADLEQLRDLVPEIIVRGRFSHGGRLPGERRGQWNGDRIKFITNDDQLKHLPKLVDAINGLSGIGRLEQLCGIAGNAEAVAKASSWARPYSHLSLEAVLDCNPDAFAARRRNVSTPTPELDVNL